MKKAVMLFSLVLLMGFGGIFLAFRDSTPPMPDVIAINDAVISAMQNDKQDEAVDSLVMQILKEQASMDSIRKSRDRTVQIFLFVFIMIMAAAGLCLYLYCERSILAPFRNLQRFARDIALGNLDIPLDMDKHGRFGAFTESFDLMREELKKARENERNADRSKKELVASISHDIKTPVASIKAATEVMLLSAKGEKDRKQLERIGEKTEQINTLITDMFHATLEELRELNVTLAEIHSTVIPRLIQSADYRGRVQPFIIPSCIALADAVRLQQVFDNIIGNSYKYADTDIMIQSFIDGRNLYIEIMDFGAGVSGDELPLIIDKFYRGSNSGDKSGYGLGLYITKTLLTQMSGDFYCENRPGGFAVVLSLRLAG